MRGIKFTGLKTTVEIVRGESSILLEVTGEGYHDPGRSYGPPENCYEAEGDVEPTQCRFGDWTCPGMPEGLTDEEEDLIIERLWEATDDWEPEDPPDRDDYRDDVDEAQEWHDFDEDC